MQQFWSLQLISACFLHAANLFPVEFSILVGGEGVSSTHLSKKTWEVSVTPYLSYLIRH